MNRARFVISITLAGSDPVYERLSSRYGGRGRERRTPIAAWSLIQLEPREKERAVCHDEMELIVSF